MKLKLLVKIIELILGEAYRSDVPRADMYLPERLLAMALIFLAGGTACAAVAAAGFPPPTTNLPNNRSPAGKPAGIPFAVTNERLS